MRLKTRQLNEIECIQGEQPVVVPLCEKKWLRAWVGSQDLRPRQQQVLPWVPLFTGMCSGHPLVMPSPWLEKSTGPNVQILNLGPLSLVLCVFSSTLQCPRPEKPPLLSALSTDGLGMERRVWTRAEGLSSPVLHAPAQNSKKATNPHYESRVLVVLSIFIKVRR